MGGGGRKSREKIKEESEKAGENIVTEDRLRCENRICILFKYIKPYLARHYVKSIQVVRKGAHLHRDPFSFRNIAEKYASNRAN